MGLVFKAGTAFLFAALMTGTLTPDPRWRAVAAELHQAEPQALLRTQLRTQLQSLFHDRKG
ncbi:MAG TPA: hypothetical protein VG821_03870 [Rhizomicrobium sp.]|jgi:hypothetical protein|nr:hypothetical protein [Rhizomicrobium sp.]